MVSDVIRPDLFLASMKHSEKNSTQAAATIIMWIVPLLLVIPNIILDFTEQYYTPGIRTANLLIPAGIYLLLMALWRRNSITSLCLIPVMILAAFQIVLIFLYGESIIAIDMFLNVLTTNVTEASELLSNLAGAIVVVVLLYLPIIVVGIVGTIRRWRLGEKSRKIGLTAGGILTVAGVIVALSISSYRPTRVLFPVNVISNIVSATERTEESNAYLKNSENYSFHSKATHSSETPEIYVLVVGETSRADNWQLNGYNRPTNPKLSKRSGLVSFKKALSESNTTHKSVPLLLTQLGCEEFADSIYSTRSVIDAFSEAGYRTAYISNQQHNGSLIDFFGSRADTCEFLCDDGQAHHDMELCTHLRRSIEDAGENSVFVVLHTYGSHFNYTERYPEEYAFFGKNEKTQANPENRSDLMDAYDNSIRYTDAVIDSIIGTAESFGRPAAVVYLADHGEDIFDDSRERFLHASPTPTYWQIHVPMLVWMSQEYRDSYPEKYEEAISHTGSNISSSRSAFHTLLSTAGIESPVYKACDALTDPEFTEPERMYLNDYNEGLHLTEAGLRRPDYDQLAAHHISY